MHNVDQLRRCISQLFFTHRILGNCLMQIGICGSKVAAVVVFEENIFLYLQYFYTIIFYTSVVGRGKEQGVHPPSSQCWRIQFKIWCFHKWKAQLSIGLRLISTNCSLHNETNIYASRFSKVVNLCSQRLNLLWVGANNPQIVLEYQVNT